MHGAATDAGTFYNAAFVPPMFSDRRVVILRGARAISWADQLASAIADLPPTTRLLLVAGEDAADKGAQNESSDTGKGKKKSSYAAAWKSVVAITGEKGRVVELKPIPKWEMESWIMDEGQRIGLDLTREAALELFSRTGNDLRLIETELEKLVVFAGQEAARIGPKDVATVVGRSSLDNIFDLVDSIAARKTGSALKSLQQLLEGGEAPQYLLYMIARQYRLLLTVKALKAERAAPSTLFKPLGTGSEYMVKKCVEQSRNFSIEALENGLAAALRTDLRLKSGRGGSPEIELQSLVTALCS
jgi:DNA polymerase-3 subunit delta